MATLAPLPWAADQRRSVTGQQFIEALRPWRKRLATQQVLRWGVKGALIGLLFACLFLLLSRWIAWEMAPYWAGGAMLACILGAVGLALYFRPSLARCARVLDERLGLRDRLGTAWELRDDAGALSAMQRRDALRRLNEHTRAGAISLWPGRLRLLALILLIAAFVLSLLAPNPLNAEIRQREAFQASISRQVAGLEQLRKVIDSQAATPTQERTQIDNILKQAINQLQQSSNSSQAQQVLAQAQGKLDQLRNPQASAKAQAQAAASQTLQSSSNSNLKSTGTALGSNDLKGLHSSLQKLASSLSGMTPAQRSQLAQQIEAAANASGSDPQLSSALHSLAKAIADGSQSEVSDAQKAVEQAATQDSADQNASSSIDKASQGLQKVADSLTASTDGSTTPQSVSSTSQQSSQGQSPSQGQTPGQSNQGNNGQGNGGSKSGKSEKVFVPGQQGAGTSNITGDGGSGRVQSGTSVSFSQVLAAYMQAAHDEIDNSAIPPDLKNLVQAYYNTLEGQK